MQSPLFFPYRSAFLLLFSFFTLNSCSNDDADSNPDQTELLNAQLSISSNTTTIAENSGVQNVVFSLSTPNTLDTAIPISYALSGTATLGADYTKQDGTVSIASGETTASLAITLIDDSDAETDESIFISLNQSQTNGITIGGTTEIIWTISDNDTDPDDDSGSDECPNDNSLSFTNIGCDTQPSETSEYSESVNNDGKRVMQVNSYPNHEYSSPREAVVTVDKTYEVSSNPQIAANITPVVRDNGRPARFFGIVLNGVIMAPAPATPFIFVDESTGEYNWDWVFEPTNNQGGDRNQVQLDCASAHKGPQGYHYHGNMFAYVETVQTGLSSGTVPDEPVQIGWASDGFPVLYLYAPDADGNLKKMTPSYQLKAGNRPGDGITEPCGPYNGKYTVDYEYVAGTGDLDACNGMERTITLTTAQGEETFEYFYVITETFPQISRCLTGTPDPSFEN